MKEILYSNYYNALPAVELCEAERTRCEVWTRVMGYHRPVSAFNAGKQAEHYERLYFREYPRALQLQRLTRAA